MKKIILVLAIAGCFMTFESCSKHTSATEVRIDFTKSYEDAAMALQSAQKKYDDAVTANVPEKILVAKEELKVAQNKYEQSQKRYVSNGGTVKPQFEDYLKKSKKSLDKSMNKVVAGLDNAKMNAASQKMKTDIDAAAHKTETEIKKTSKEVKYKTDKALHKAKNDLQKFFK
ncbi:hypothetical protein [Chryseobacterium sp. G0201]|uniref:hypothetical protein n=1 Tax=Chryseobacterium sp. G0201 TaxID=2487065 RepID=UPI000F50A930|nr:hypothetical protein [Chryseobacterium sp. G0201]